jgi:SAM-dependent methyltransferase
MNATAAVAQSQPEWFASWFDSEHYHRLYANRDQFEADAFVDRLIAHLDPAPGAAMLDLGCGSGRHARSLASRGFRVTGIDLSGRSLDRARRHGGPPVRFIEQDMRVPFGSREFEYVFSLFTSFGYFEHAADNAAVIRNIARSLTPGGTLILDYLNVEHAETALVPAEIVTRGGVIYRITRWSDPDAFFKRIVVDDPRRSARLEHVERVSKLTLPDFRRLLARCGFSIDGVFGSYALDPFDPSRSPRLIVVAGNTTSVVATLPAREVLADPAEGLRRHAEIRREHGLRHALDDRRVGVEESEISLFCSGAQRTDDPLVLGGVVPLQSGAERGAVTGHGVDEALMGRRID